MMMYNDVLNYIFVKNIRLSQLMHFIRKILLHPYTIVKNIDSWSSLFFTSQNSIQSTNNTIDNQNFNINQLNLKFHGIYNDIIPKLIMYFD